MAIVRKQIVNFNVQNYNVGKDPHGYSVHEGDATMMLNASLPGQQN